MAVKGFGMDFKGSGYRVLGYRDWEFGDRRALALALRCRVVRGWAVIGLCGVEEFL